MDGSVGHSCEGFIVRDYNKGLPPLVAKVKEKTMKLFLVLCIKRTAGLVGKDDVGLVDKGTGNGYTLFLAARKLVGLVVGTVRE